MQFCYLGNQSIRPYFKESDWTALTSHGDYFIHTKTRSCQWSATLLTYNSSQSRKREKEGKRGFILNNTWQWTWIFTTVRPATSISNAERLVEREGERERLVIKSSRMKISGLQFRSQAVVFQIKFTRFVSPSLVFLSKTRIC